MGLVLRQAQVALVERVEARDGEPAQAGKRELGLPLAVEAALLRAVADDGEPRRARQLAEGLQGVERRLRREPRGGHPRDRLREEDDREVVGVALAAPEERIGDERAGHERRRGPHDGVERDLHGRPVVVAVRRGHEHGRRDERPRAVRERARRDRDDERPHLGVRVPVRLTVRDSRRRARERQRTDRGRRSDPLHFLSPSRPARGRS